MKVLFLTRYRELGASSRIRCYQFIPYLESGGFQITVAPLLGNDYVRKLYDGKIRILSVLQAYISRLCCLSRISRFDIVWVEKEMLPWMPGWLEIGLLPKRTSMVVDYDDAVFHSYDKHRLGLVRALWGKKIDAIMRGADLVVVGNDYLGNRARLAGALRVEYLPSVVDTVRYTASPNKSGEPMTIGWIGSPVTAKYLNLVTDVLQHLVTSRGIRVVAVGAASEQFAGSPIEVRPWTEMTEVTEIQHFDIGIMPLKDESWECGKCGYKLIQYMACGIPVVASPVGVNLDIVQHGINGFLASNKREWIQWLELLCNDAGLREQMGRIGRARIEKEYSLHVVAPKLDKMLRSVVNSRKFKAL